jgi:hypothetical protein
MTTLVTAEVKFLPAESISMVYFVLLLSVACFGLDQLSVSTTLLESTGAGAMVVVEADNTGAVPLPYKGMSAALSQAASKTDMPQKISRYLKFDRI